MSGHGLPPAGWYREPNDPTQERIWDGDEWRRWVRPYLANRVEPNPAGWYLDPWRSDQEHLWTGDMWSGLTRPNEGVAPRLRRVPVPPPAGMRYADPNPPISIENLGNWTCLALVLTILAQLAHLVFRQIYIARLGDLINGRLVTIHRLETAIDNAQATGLIYAGLALVTAILFVTWFYRAYRNLIRFGIGDVRYGLGWTVGGWFIPIFSFFRQKAIANDIWKGSASAAEGDVGGWRAAPLSNLVNWWWGVWIASTLAGFGGFRSSESLGELERSSLSTLRGDRIGAYFGQAGALLSIAAAVLAILVVRRISQMQERVVEGWEGSELAAAAANASAAAGATASAAASITAATTKVCPECAEDVKAAARVCRFCGHRFEEPVGAGSDSGSA